MKLRLALIALLLSASSAFAQTTVPLTNGQAVIPAQVVNVTINGTVVPITIPAQTVVVTGNTVVPAGSGGTGTTYTGTCGVAVNGSVISLNWPTVPWTGGSRALAATDMMRTNVVSGGAPVTITLGAAPGTGTCTATAFKVEGTGTSLILSGAPADTPAVILPGQAVTIEADGAATPAWHQERGAGQ